MVCEKGDNSCPVTDFRITWCPESCEFNKQIPKKQMYLVKTIVKGGATWITKTDNPPMHMGEQSDGSFVREISGVPDEDDHKIVREPVLTEAKLWELVDISNDKKIRNEIINWIWSLPCHETTSAATPVNPPINFHPCSGCSCMLDDNLGCPEMKTCLDNHMCRVAEIASKSERKKILDEVIRQINTGEICEGSIKSLQHQNWDQPRPPCGKYGRCTEECDKFWGCNRRSSSETRKKLLSELQEYINLCEWNISYPELSYEIINSWIKEKSK